MKDLTEISTLFLRLWLILAGLTWYYWGDINPHLPGFPGLPSFLKKKS